MRLAAPQTTKLPAGSEVVLVNDRVPSVKENPNARYLSERTQLGSGNTLNRERTLIPKSSLMPLDRVGIPSGDGLAEQQAGADTGEEELIATHSPSQKILYFAATSAATGRVRNCRCYSRNGPTLR